MSVADVKRDILADYTPPPREPPKLVLADFVEGEFAVNCFFHPVRCDACGHWTKAKNRDEGTCGAIRETQDEVKARVTGSVGACFDSEFETAPDFGCALFGAKADAERKTIVEEHNRLGDRVFAGTATESERREFVMAQIKLDILEADTRGAPK